MAQSDSEDEQNVEGEAAETKQESGGKADDSDKKEDEGKADENGKSEEEEKDGGGSKIFIC